MTRARRPNPSRPLAVCYGTRPQVIKASLLIEALTSRWPLLTIDTGQHYDYELNELLYRQLGVAPPNHYLGVRAATHARQVSQILTRVATVLQRARPWAVVVVGDTNSTLGCALAAAQLGIPVVHVEAGLRASDPFMAEEINRRVVDVVSALLCAPSDAATVRLKSERVNGVVVRTGDIARDVLVRFAERAPQVDSIPGWPVGRGEPFIFATFHRAELTGDPDTVRGVVEALGGVETPVILAAHPRLRAALDSYGLCERLPPNIFLREPLGYLEAVACTAAARLVVTDSGGLQREAYWLRTPCVTLRRDTEWVETVQLGANVLVDPSKSEEELASAVSYWEGCSSEVRRWNQDAYGDGNAASAIRDAIAELADARGISASS